MFNIVYKNINYKISFEKVEPLLSELYHSEPNVLYEVVIGKIEKDEEYFFPVVKNQIKWNTIDYERNSIPYAVKQKVNNFWISYLKLLAFV